MTKQELRLAVLRLVWPDGPDRRGADPAYYLQRAEVLEEWILDGGQSQADPAEPGKRPRGRPRKSSPIPDNSTTDILNQSGPSQ